MKPALLTGAALLMAVMSPVAFAQTTQVPSGRSPAGVTSSPPNPGTAGTMNPPANESAGAITPSGSRGPAAMNPSGAASAGAMNSADSARAGSLADAAGLFANVPARAGLSSKVVGLSVYNSENTDLGTIKDIAFDANGVKAYIVAVGGFLGVGDRYVAVRPSAINISYDAAKDKWQALMNTDADQLKSAPEFKYSSAG
jgi:sporulation protein YlmC with PRC-barrel domain